MFDIITSIVVLLFPIGLVLGLCEKPRMNYDEAIKKLKNIDN